MPATETPIAPPQRDFDQEFEEIVERLDEDPPPECSLCHTKRPRRCPKCGSPSVHNELLDGALHECCFECCGCLFGGQPPNPCNGSGPGH